MTNIKLVTWEEFQGEFSETWLEKHFSPTITDELATIIEYTGPLPPDWFLKVPEHEVPVLRSLREKHQPFGLLMLGLKTSGRMLCNNGFPELPIRDRLTQRFSNSTAIPDSILDAIGYREFLDLVLEYGRMAASEFEDVKQRNNV